MTLRSQCNERQLWAHEILDRVKAGIYVPDHQVKYALIVLGDVE